MDVLLYCNKGFRGALQPRGKRSIFSFTFAVFCLYKGGEMSLISMSEKRKAARFQVSIPVMQMQYKDASINSHTFDISSDGIGLVMDAELPLGQSLDLDLRMPDTGETIRIRGKAVWMTIAGPGRYRAGIRFETGRLKPIPLVLRTIRLNNLRRFS
jgi:hypothetical protein